MGKVMPYTSNDQLPISVRNHLPPHAQDIYREAFNHAWASYAHRSRQEQIAHRVAWAAVKRLYHKDPDGLWRTDWGPAIAGRVELSVIQIADAG